MIDPLAGDARPTVRGPQQLADRYALPIDFAFVRAPALPAVRIQSDLCFGDRVPIGVGRPRYLSDHLAVELRVSWEAARI